MELEDVDKVVEVAVDEDKVVAVEDDELATVVEVEELLTMTVVEVVEEVVVLVNCGKSFSISLILDSLFCKVTLRFISASFIEITSS